MEKESTFGDRGGTQHVEQRTPGADAMNSGSTIVVGGPAELPSADFHLFFDRRGGSAVEHGIFVAPEFEDPAV